MADQYPGSICNSLLAAYLCRRCLQSGYQYQHRARVHNETNEVRNTVFVLSGHGNTSVDRVRLGLTRAFLEKKKKRLNGRAPQKAQTWLGARMCTRQAAARKVTGGAGPDHFRQLISNAIGKGQHLHV